MLWNCNPIHVLIYHLIHRLHAETIDALHKTWLRFAGISRSPPVLELVQVRCGISYKRRKNIKTTSRLCIYIISAKHHEKVTYAKVQKHSQQRRYWTETIKLTISWETKVHQWNRSPLKSFQAPVFDQNQARRFPKLCTNKAMHKIIY